MQGAQTQGPVCALYCWSARITPRNVTFHSEYFSTPEPLFSYRLPCHSSCSYSTLRRSRPVPRPAAIGQRAAKPRSPLRGWASRFARAPLLHRFQAVQAMHAYVAGFDKKGLSQSPRHLFMALILSSGPAAQSQCTRRVS